MNLYRYIIVAVTTSLLVTSGVFAQKGVGDENGIASQATKPSVTTLSGRISEIKQEPCENSTGKSPVGVHLIIKTNEQKDINLHLGPEDAVDHIVQQIAVGDSLTFAAFRTEKLPEGAFIAKSLTFNEKVVHLRDENLRPSWAYGQGKGKGRGAQGRRGRHGPCW
jgi:hypothetical protein